MRWTRIAERFVDDVILLDLSGQALPSDPVRQLADRVRDLLSESRTKIVLNLVDVPYVDSEGLAEMVDAYKAAQEVGGVLKLCAVAGSLRHVLKTTRLDSFLEIFDSEQDAVESCRTLT